MMDGLWTSKRAGASDTGGRRAQVRTDENWRQAKRPAAGVGARHDTGPRMETGRQHEKSPTTVPGGMPKEAPGGAGPTGSITSSATQTTNLPVNIQVNTVSGNSGIYLGSTNTVCGVSAHSKSNMGFGSIGSSNMFVDNVSFVHDPDIIDTPIDDRDTHILHPGDRPASETTRIGVGRLDVNTLTQNSAVFMGTANITGMDSHEKQNLAHGQIYGGWNIGAGNQNMTVDNDWIDAPIFDQDYKGGVFLNK
ncbi:hypothetical protein GI364_16000 [Alicyclobacillus sp. SO9]|nr:hypothetical protein GI364_16000 [Alicyclobacillus sp. SO9]